MKKYYDLFNKNNEELISKIQNTVLDFNLKVLLERETENLKTIHNQKIIDLFHKDLKISNLKSHLNAKSNIDLIGYSQSEEEYVIKINFDFRHENLLVSIVFNLIYLKEEKSTEANVGKVILRIEEENLVSFILSEKQTEFLFKRRDKEILEKITFEEKESKIVFKKGCGIFFHSFTKEYELLMESCGLSMEFRKVAEKEPEMLYNYALLGKYIEDELIDSYALNYDLNINKENPTFDKYRININTIKIS